MPLPATTWESTGDSRLCPVHHSSDELPEEGGKFRAVLPHPQPEVRDHLRGGEGGTQGDRCVASLGSQGHCRALNLPPGLPEIGNAQGPGMGWGGGRRSGQHLVIPTSARV